MYRVAIVEDDPASAERSREHLQAYSREHNVEFTVTLYQDGDELVQGYRHTHDMIFLDIQMTFLDGMSAAEAVRKVDGEVILIFITNTPQFAIKGYLVDALSYLLKPVSYFMLSQELTRSLAVLEKRASFHLLVPQPNGLLKVDVRGIRYIESYQHRVIVHEGRAVLSFIGTLKEMEAKLAGRGFCRCHNGCLVNLAYVTGVRDNDVLLGDLRLAVSRPRRKAFLLALTEYVGNGP